MQFCQSPRSQSLKLLYFICNNISLLLKLSYILDTNPGYEQHIFGQNNLYSYVFVMVR